VISTPLTIHTFLMAAVAVKAPVVPAGIKQYYQAKIESAELLINQKTQNLRRLEAQRNALNARGTYILTSDRVVFGYLIVV
jgi:hypothetical protein